MPLNIHLIHQNDQDNELNNSDELNFKVNFEIEKKNVNRQNPNQIRSQTQMEHNLYESQQESILPNLNPDLSMTPEPKLISGGKKSN